VTTPGKRRAVFRGAAVAVALYVFAAGIFLLWGVVREPLFLKWAAVAVALGLFAAGIYSLWGVVRWSLFLKWLAVAVALYAYIAGIYLLWGVVREPLFLKWAAVAVAVALGVYAAGIYLLWGVVRWSLFLNWAAVAVALGVFAVGMYLLWGVWDGRPLAAAFTRVGGATRVETALEASRFWLTPPRCVVMTQSANQGIMFAAAWYAMIHDAPLLFTSGDPKRNQLVDATIADWQKAPGHPTKLDMITFTSDGGMKGRCPGKPDPADFSGLSTLAVPDQLLRPPHVAVRNTLAPVVVFAAAIEPGDPPDVAVGMALAAHMARANGEKVSLVVVPQYLESDLELEKKLQSQHELVTGGVVLGETPTVPEDTRALLRQLLTSTDRQGVAAQVQANLGSVGSLIAALLALVGLGTAFRVAGPIVIGGLKRAEEKRAGNGPPPTPPPPTPPPTEPPPTEPPPTEPPQPRIWVFIMSNIRKIGIPGSVTQKESAWLTALGEDRKATVTIWLRSGQQVTGIIEDQFPANARDATVFRIRNAPSAPKGTEPSRGVSAPRPEGNRVLVPVKDIELIEFSVNDSESEAAKASQQS
jgi:hypothetical protein